MTSRKTFLIQIKWIISGKYTVFLIRSGTIYIDSGILKVSIDLGGRSTPIIRLSKCSIATV